MENIKLEIQDHIGILTISREKALNALNTNILKELGEAVETVQNNRDIRCLVITGEGSKAFVAGADIAEMLATDASEGVPFSELGSRVFLEIERLPVPVIAAVNGYALGGGCELALCCDIRIASENALFGTPEVGLGLIPGWGGTQRLARIVGLGMAKEMVFTGSSIHAAEALSIGLVNHVFPQDTLMDEALKKAKKIAGNAPIAVRNAKKAINEGMQCDMDSGLKIETEKFGLCFASRDAKKGMNAFLNREKGIEFDNQ